MPMQGAPLNHQCRATQSPRAALSHQTSDPPLCRCLHFGKSRSWALPAPSLRQVDGAHVEPVAVAIDDSDLTKPNRIRVVVAEGRNREVCACTAQGGAGGFAGSLGGLGGWQGILD
jgi:hypothetical protein